MWPTPAASIAQDGETPETWEARRQRLLEKGINGNGAGTPLTIAAARWPTPTSTDATVRQWATPAARDWRSENPDQSPDHSPPLGRQVLQEIGPEYPDASGRRRLNPNFVEWLMGLPIGWTVCVSLGTACALNKQS